jgi:GxxExxY protein
MDTDRKEGKYRVFTEGIIKVFYKVYNTRGYGFLEKVYENAIVVELKREGINAIAQAPIKVLYDGHVVAE